MRAKAPWLFAALFLTMTFCVAAGAQVPAKKHLPGQLASDVPSPNPKGTNPKPEDATAAILGAFEKYEVVGMSAAHGNKTWTILFSASFATLLFPRR